MAETYELEQLDGDVYMLIGMIVFGLMIVVILFGLAGNILSMIVWSRPHLKSSSSVVLVALAVCDTLVILSGLWRQIPVIHESLEKYNGSPVFNSTIDNFINYNYYTQWSIIVSRVIYKMGVTASMHLTVIITVERYVCICHPFQFKEWCPYSRTCKFVALTLIFSVVYRMSGFWEFWVVGLSYFEEGKIVTVYMPVASDLLRDPVYRLFYNTWVFVSIDYLLPLSCIIILNTITYIKLKRIKRERRALTNQQSNENKLTKMVIYVVVEFLVCTAFGGFLTLSYSFPNIKRFFYDYSFRKIFVMYQVQAFLNSLNSSINLVTYVSSWQPFRKTFIKMFCCRKKRDQRPPACPDHTPNASTTSV